MKRTPNPRNNLMRWTNLSYSERNIPRKVEPPRNLAKMEEGEHRIDPRQFQAREKTLQIGTTSTGKTLLLKVVHTILLCFEEITNNEETKVAFSCRKRTIPSKERPPQERMKSSRRRVRRKMSSLWRKLSKSWSEETSQDTCWAIPPLTLHWNVCKVNDKPPNQYYCRDSFRCKYKKNTNDLCPSSNRRRNEIRL